MQFLRILFLFNFIGVLAYSARTEQDSLDDGDDDGYYINEIKTLDEPPVITILKNDKRVYWKKAPHYANARYDFPEAEQTGSSTSATTSLPLTTALPPQKVHIQSLPKNNSLPVARPVVLQMANPAEILQQGQMMNPMFRSQFYPADVQSSPITPNVGFNEFLSRFFNPFQGLIAPIVTANSQPENHNTDFEQKLSDSDLSTEEDPDNTSADVKKESSKSGGSKKGCMQRCEKAKTRDICTIICNQGPSGNTGEGTFFQWNNAF